MKSILFLVFVFFNSIVYSQVVSTKKIENFILTRYDSDSLIEHSIDTIVNLPENRCFVLVKNEVPDASASTSGYFDCYELNISADSIDIRKAALYISNETGGGGYCEIRYKLYKIDKEHYLVIVLKNISNHGTFCQVFVF